ncbi:hypothetical protein BLS_004806 [Venturia inaequalis]|uniref:Glycosyl transferase family 25 domain-containing protein n=1 Tax=Venturia inaequalis TaxID=5025 RepID=A0A8H3UK35_VENIN|nr:hypothetical protein BLS_004806 [Venturia inaequalis]
MPLSWSMGKSPALGCWRSHANVWRKIINEDIATAIILEDDADWDVNVKEQMFLQSQAILSNPNLVTNDNSVENGKPYRDDWDIFFLGACGVSPHVNKTANVGPYLVVKDPFMEERRKLTPTFIDSLNHFGVHEEGERVLFRASGSVRGITTAPAIFAMFKTNSSRDSDIQTFKSSNKKVANADGHTPQIRESARVAMKDFYAHETPAEEYWEHSGL